MQINERTRTASPMAEKASILVVENNSRDAERMVRGIRQTAPHWDVETTSSGSDCLLRLTQRRVSAIVLDHALPDADGLEILDEIVQRNYPAPVIWLAEVGQETSADHALREGAYDYVLKDEEHFRQLPQVVSGALQRYRLEQEHRRIHATLDAVGAIQQVLASSQDVDEAQGLVLDVILRWARARSTWLLLRGATGDLEAAAWRGRVPGVALGQRFPVPEIWTRQKLSALSPRLFSLDDAQPWLGPSASREAATSGVERVWGAPLLIGGSVEGMLVLFPPGEAETGDPVVNAETLRLLSGTLAMFIENLRMRERDAEARAEVQAAQQKLATTEKLRMLGAMASGIVHDFNNVLAVIKARAGLAKRRTEDPALLRDMDIVVQAVGDGTRTVRRLQEMVGIHKGRSLFAPVSVNRVVQSAVELTRPRWKDQLQANGIPIEVRLDLQPVPEIAGSEAELREGLINLIFNALDAMPNGGRLTLATRPQPAPPPFESEGAVVITVQDTGEGISAESLAHVFDPFYTTKGGHHTGMGLSISQNIVGWHGGDIRAESRPGAGSVVTITLPTAAAVKPARKTPPAEMPQRPVSLLFIDDERGVREYFHEFLESEGHTVVSASSGDEGLRLLKSRPFDVVVTDLGLPGMSGWEVAQQVHDRSPETPILLLTGWGEPLDPETMKASGIIEVLKKPFEGAAVLEFIARYTKA